MLPTCCCLKFVYNPLASNGYEDGTRNDELLSAQNPPVSVILRVNVGANMFLKICLKVFTCEKGGNYLGRCCEKQLSCRVIKPFRVFDSALPARLRAVSMQGA